MTPDELKQWAECMREAGVSAVSTQEFSITLNPLAPETFPSRDLDEPAEPQEIEQIPGMCVQCQKNPAKGMLPGLCRECTHLAFRRSVA